MFARIYFCSPENSQKLFKMPTASKMADISAPSINTRTSLLKSAKASLLFFFLYICVGGIGKLFKPESRIFRLILVLRRSSIFRRAEGGDILIAPTVNINGNEIGPYLVGDSAYPLSPWLMKPYPEGTRDRAEIKFNKELSSARVKVECAFGLIKSRWRILQKRFDSTIDFAVKNAIACAVLHNLCIRLGDNWEEEDGDDNYPCPPIAGPNIIRDADNMREILKDYIQ